MRIQRVSRVVGDLDRSAAFYRDALGFRAVSRGAAPFTFGAGEAQEVVMRLGAAEIALVRFAVPGEAYPEGSQSNDLWFQHLAVVAGDMDAAYAHLTASPGWRAISRDGPQRLPPENGNVRAFKFRDPDGHPLELLWFPDRGPGPLFAGVDHSALAVSSTARSLVFYTALGFRVTDRSLNRGPAQSRLDSLPDAHAHVTGLRPEAALGPGLELLGYTPPGRSAIAVQPNDIANDWVTIEVPTLCGDTFRAMRDPDGHRMLLVVQGSGAPD